jgi:hypothetical protein
MKRNIILSLGLCAALAGPVLAQDTRGLLYDELSHAKEVKIYVASPADSTGKTNLDVSLFQKKIEEVLSARKSIHFSVVPSESEARFKVETEILGFVFSEKDPVDMLMGVGMATLDAIKNDHFASVDAKMTVKEISGSERWSDKIHASLTDEKMTEAESRVKILNRAAEIFVREAFGKPRRS